MEVLIGLALHICEERNSYTLRLMTSEIDGIWLSCENVQMGIKPIIERNCSRLSHYIDAFWAYASVSPAVVAVILTNFQVAERR